MKTKVLFFCFWVKIKIIQTTTRIIKNNQQNEFSWGIFVGASELAQRKVSVKNLADRQTSLISI